MEDPRISRMYLAMLERSLNRMFGRFTSGGWLRSSVTWIVLLGLVLVAVGIIVREKGRGDLHKLKTELRASGTDPAVITPQPGGQDALVLSRSQESAGITPEFLSATLLPGRGMNVLQITAFLPGKGEVSLLDSPSLADAAQTMSGIEGDVNGEESLAMGGAFEVPWAGQISGAALPGGMAVLANWRGRGITLPVAAGANAAQSAGAQSAISGLLLKRQADSPSMRTVPNGSIAEASLNVGSFDGHWPSRSEVRTTVLLGARTMDLTVVAHNAGTEPEPMGIGWRPRFAIPAGDREKMLLRVPSVVRTATANGLPTGALLPVQGTGYDFASHGGAALGTMSLNDTFVHLRGGTLSTGPEIELHNAAAGYGIRLTALSPSIKAVRVFAPTDKPIIIIDPQTNYDDPFGREWPKDEDTGMVVLQPGESLQWKVRLEIFQVTGHDVR